MSLAALHALFDLFVAYETGFIDVAPSHYAGYVYTRADDVENIADAAGEVIPFRKEIWDAISEGWTRDAREETTKCLALSRNSSR